MLGTEINVNKNKKRKIESWKKIAIFLLFEFIFTTATMPLLVFYGPFTNVKKTVVGTFWATWRHQYLAKIFLSNEAIERIIGSDFAVNPQINGEKIQEIDFKVNHTDKIDVYNIEGGSFVGKLMVIYDPTRIQVGFSNQIPKSGEITSAIAKRNKAVAAINAGGFKNLAAWTDAGGEPDGFIIHDGKIVYNPYQNENVKTDVVAFTKKGMLIVGQHSIADLKQYEVTEAVSFGPPLIVNGKPTITSGDGGWGIAPRTAIGQRQNGEVLFLVIDGRSLQSFGASLRDVQDILLEQGAVNASNLDGGSSTTMYYNGKIINRPSDALGERAVPSVFMVMPMAGGSSK